MCRDWAAKRAMGMIWLRSEVVVLYGVRWVAFWPLESESDIKIVVYTRSFGSNIGYINFESHNC